MPTVIAVNKHWHQLITWRWVVYYATNKQYEEFVDAYTSLHKIGKRWIRGLKYYKYIIKSFIHYDLKLPLY